MVTYSPAKAIALPVSGSVRIPQRISQTGQENQKYHETFWIRKAIRFS